MDNCFTIDVHIGTGLNTSFHATSKLTLFQIVYKREPSPLLRFEKGTIASAMEQQLLERDSILDELKSQLLKAQVQMKELADRKWRDVQFDMGDMVYVKIRPNRQKRLAKRLNEKLSPRFYGPFPVEKRIGNVAYKLSLPLSSAVHPLFHVSQLHKAEGAIRETLNIPDQLSAKLEMKVSLEFLLGIRPGTGKNLRNLDILIPWKELPPLEAT